MSFPDSDYETIYTTGEAHLIAQLADLMRDNGLDYRVHGSRNASSIDQVPLMVRIRLQVVHAQLDQAKALLAAFFTPLDPNSPDLPEELRPDPDDQA